MKTSADNCQLNRPVLFLDFDDVLCLNNHFGGYDVISALSQVQKGSGKVQDFEELWGKLFASEACALLRKLHDEFKPIYVLSTSWRLFMNGSALDSVLMNTGLEFVARNLHQDWQTPNFLTQQTRVREIGSWLGRNPDHESSWVVLDDERSGTGYGDDYPIQENLPFIVLCKENCGLQALEYDKLRAAFALRQSINNLMLRTP